MVITTATKKVFALTKRIRAVSGGASAGKTLGILQTLIHLAQKDKVPTITSIVSESFPHLEKGAIRDFKRTLQESNYWNDNLWNESKHFYKFETGSIIEFFSVDEAAKVHGPRRTRLFVNEAPNIDFSTYEHLELRTKECVYLDWNPYIEFWFYTELLPKQKDLEHITLTYLDNEALSLQEREALESKKYRTNWWKVYGLGQLGDIEGKIYSDWKIIDAIPHEARLERYGLDFGYTNDPTAIVAVYYLNGGWILDECCYKKGMSNKEIADTFKAMKERLIIADSAEPKSIDELRAHGLNVQPAQKGKDSVKNGIQFVQDQPISVTRRSVNLLDEYRKYLWKIDKNGKILNEPEGGYDHLLDGARYALSTLAKLEHPVSYWDKIWEQELTPKKKSVSLER